MAVGNGYQPWYQGQTRPGLTFPINLDSQAENLTGVTAANIHLIMRRTDVTPAVDRTATGLVTIVTANPAVVSFFFSALDVTVPGQFQFQFTALFPDGSQQVYDPFGFNITAV